MAPGSAPGWASAMAATSWKSAVGCSGMTDGHSSHPPAPRQCSARTVIVLMDQNVRSHAGHRAATIGTWVRMVINYLVPFLVASVGYLGAPGVAAQKQTDRLANRVPPLVSVAQAHDARRPPLGIGASRGELPVAPSFAARR